MQDMNSYVKEIDKNVNELIRKLKTVQHANEKLSKENKTLKLQLAQKSDNKDSRSGVMQGKLDFAMTDDESNRLKIEINDCIEEIDECLKELESE